MRKEQINSIIIKIVFIILIINLPSIGQILAKNGFHFQESPVLLKQGILGNGIVDILVKDSIVWIATGYGLNKTSDEGDNWTQFTTHNYIGKGGVTAMTYMDEQTLWIATSFDTITGDEGSLAAGGGLNYTRDGGQTWDHVPQPVDSRDETEYKPTTTNVQNLTFDIAALDSTIWIASFGGGLRRSDDMGKTWQVVTTDGIPFSALEFLNHRAFSVISGNGNLWVGTAEGISKSMDNGETWQRMTSKNQEFAISGNFVVALAYQEFANTIWAATIETDTSEIRAVSKSEDGGLSWTIMLEGTFPHNFAFDNERVYVAADEGIFISDDGGENWYILPHIRDDSSGEEILTSIYYSAGVSYNDTESMFWAGSADGLAMTFDNGNSWRVFRSFESTRKMNSPDAYVYPSPFSPSRSGYVRFQYDISASGEILIEIFDFSMDKVATIRDYKYLDSQIDADRSTKWDGRADNGNIVASGVYLFRLKLANKVAWGKVVVIN